MTMRKPLILLAALLLPLSTQAQEMQWEDYETTSTLAVPQNPVTKAKYPFIDAHAHQWRIGGASESDVAALVAEMDKMKARRPARGSHAPGTFWYYNNWDFNALGTIFEQRTGIGIYHALEQRLGRPLQMQDCTADKGRQYDQETLSAHPVHHFDMSARDMARFGLLYLRRGRWRGRQLIPAAWIDRSTTPYSDVGDDRRGYGYMWWIGKAEAFGGHALYMARGGDGHALYVVPALDVVVVHRIDRLTFARGWNEVDQLLVMILKAHPRG